MYTSTKTIGGLGDRVIVKMTAQEHNGKVQFSSYSYHATFENEDDRDMFDAEMEAYTDQQNFLDMICEEDLAELGIKL